MRFHTAIMDALALAELRQGGLLTLTAQLHKVVAVELIAILGEHSQGPGVVAKRVDVSSIYMYIYIHM